MYKEINTACYSSNIEILYPNIDYVEFTYDICLLLFDRSAMSRFV